MIVLMNWLPFSKQGEGQPWIQLDMSVEQHPTMKFFKSHHNFYIEQYAYSFQWFFLAAPQSCCSRHSLRRTSLTPTVHNTLCLHTRSEQGRCTTARAAKLEQNIHRPPLKEEKKGREDLIIGQNFQRALISMVQK